ncbi:hypothetical protein BFP77_00400 [Maribacter sp. 4U21]|uniref:DUF6973 domain-containing protein n=1 Tax=Maribacter sp. 4U21 TaxID=1889779 RepID=UPI000C157A6B|nr:hypothetical protein [Maribacter sp. 4U21]PIB27657.1 hypothetical protein BFP77_00400 [Maribacter sp. 4U21]
MSKIKNSLFLILAISLITCEKHNTDSEIIEDVIFEELESQDIISPTSISPFAELSEDLKNTFKENSARLESVYSTSKKKIPFGGILTEKVNVGRHDDGSISYTLGLKNLNQEELYFDNMLVQLDSDGNKTVNIIRYEPEKNWLKFKNDKDRYTHYSGRISVYDEFGKFNYRISLENGTINKIKYDTRTGECFFKVTYVVGCAYTCFISEIIIETQCVGKAPGGSGSVGDTGGVGGVGGDNTGGASGPGSSFGGSGSGGIGTSPFDAYIEAYENDLMAFEEFKQDYRSKMSDSELNIFDTLTFSQQTGYLKSAYDAQTKANELYLTPCERYNGKGDAFRHAYWNALSSLKIGDYLTKRLTDAHENKPYNYAYSSKERQMDLFNNNKGREIAKQNHTDLASGILGALNRGELRYLSNQASSNCRATYSSSLIKTNQ